MTALSRCRETRGQGLHHQSDADAKGRGQRLRGVRPQGARRGARPASVVRGLRRRLRQHGRAGAHDCGVGTEREREDPGHQHQGAVLGRAHTHAVVGRGGAQRDRDLHARSGPRGRRRARSETGAIVSVFAGRIADTGVDPMPHMRACKQILASRPKAELLWASTRELLNIFQADEPAARSSRCRTNS